MTARLRHARAFTLMEVLATLVLIGIVLPVAMRGVSMSLQAAGQARRTLDATQLAQQKLAELLVVRDAGEFNGSGDFGAAWPDYRWQVRGTAADHGLYRVSVTVAWSQRGVGRSVRLDTLIYPLTAPTADTEEAG